MSELPGSAAVGIEAVEWFADQAGSLTLQITGRWRRRRPVGAGQPTLVVESDGRRHRFPAMPEPPSLAGTGPGVWRLTFTVPRWIAPDLGRSWLQFGSVIAPLPVARPAEAPPSGVPAPDAAPADTPAQDAPSSGAPSAGAPLSDASPAGDDVRVPDEPAASPAEPPPPPAPDGENALAELAERVTALERDLETARAEREELLASLAERDRTRRHAEQRAHAEQALRQDLARQLASSAREAERARQALGDLAAAEDRIRALENELLDARRRSDEAEQVAAAATAARERAERGPSGTGAGPPGEAEAARIELEERLRALRAAAARRVPTEPQIVQAPEPAAPAPAAEEPTPAPGPPPAVTPEAAARWPATVAEGPFVQILRREIDARARAEAGLRARLIDAEARLAARVLLERRTATAVGRLRTELGSLHDALRDERGRRQAAEQRAGELERELGDQRAASGEASSAIDALRASLRELTAAVGPSTAGQSSADAEPAAEREPSGEAEPAAEPGPPSETPPDPAPAPSAAPAPAPAAARETSAAVEADRLRDALSRLRQSIPPQDLEMPAATPNGAEPPAPAPVAPAAPAETRLPVVPPRVPEPPETPDPIENPESEAEPAAAEPDAPPAAGPAPNPPLHEVLGRRSLERPFRRLVRADADAAGRLLLELLPLQSVVHPEPVTYDLVLGRGRSCVCVTAAGGSPLIAVQSGPRARDAVDFQVYGEPARIARLLTAGWFRRRFGRGVARIRGDRGGIATLGALLATPLDLAGLHGEGVRLDPATTLSLAASMIDPAWTAGDRFVLAHEEGERPTAYLAVAEGRPVQVTRTAPGAPVTTSLLCRRDELMSVLAGTDVDGLVVRGETAPLAALRHWIKRAESE